MSTDRDQRRVLIIGEEPDTRNTVRLLLHSMGCQCVVAANVQQALAALVQESPDAAIFDLQRTSSSAAQVVSGLDTVCPSLRGRVLVLTGERIDPEINDVIERYSLPRVPRERLLQELWGSLESLFRWNTVFRRVTHAARLIFDSFLQPLPVGVRIAQLPTRRLVYESGNVMADLWIEPQTDSRRLALVGQIADSTRPDRRFDTVPVMLHGRKGPIALATTNKFGEFQFEFDFESSVTLEMETSANQWLSIVLPCLEWAEKKEAAGAS